MRQALEPERIHLRREVLRRARTVEHDVRNRGALLVRGLSFNPGHSVGPRHAPCGDEPLYANVLGSGHGDDEIEIATLTRLEKQRDVVDHDVDAIEPCLLVCRDSGSEHIGMHDVIEPPAIGVVGEDQPRKRLPIKLPVDKHCVPEGGHDVHERCGSGLYDAAGKDVMVDHARTKELKAMGGGGLPGPDPTRQSDAQHLGIFTRPSLKGNLM